MASCLLLPHTTMTLRYDATEPSRAAVDEIRGPVVIEFGADWCGHCQAAQPLIAAALARHPDVQHLKIADGKGRPLGRSFGVKLWPTLVFLRDGQETMRVIRPTELGTVQQGLASITEPAPTGASR
jgi:thioredoxin 1